MHPIAAKRGGCDADKISDLVNPNAHKNGLRDDLMNESIPWMCHICHYSFPTGQGAICYRCSRSCCLQHTHVLETESSSGKIKRYKVDSHLQLIAAVRRHSIGQSQLKFICSGCINEAES